MGKIKNRAFDHSKYRDWINPQDVTPYPMNAKQHNDRQIKNIVNSIRRFGWQQDVVITSDNVLVIGHGRRLAALEIGCEMPYHVIDKTADELTDEDIRELRIADNQTNAETGMDFDMLNIEIEDLDFSGFDFDFSDSFDGADEQGAEQPDQIKPEAKGSLAQRYLVPPFSVIYANKQDWLARKRMWVAYGIRSEIGRGGGLAYNTRSNPEANFLQLPAGGQTFRNEQSFQKQQQAKHIYAKAYADGLIEKRERVRKYGRTV